MSATLEPTTAPTQRNPWRRQIGHIDLSRRKYGTPSVASNRPVADRAVRWLVPWSRDTYPGIGRASVQILSGAVGAQAIKNWRLGLRRLPPWAAERFAAEIERRCAEGFELVEELRQYSADWKPYDRSKPAFLEIDPESGLRRKFRG
jgi:hypothetical protein